MESAELGSCIGIVFEKENQDLYSGIHTFDVYNTKDGYSIRYPHSDTLGKLYLSIRNNPKLESYFLDTLKEGTANSEELLLLPLGTYSGIASLCFYTLIRIGYAEEAITALKKRRKGCEGLFHLILRMLPTSCFGLSQLQDILSKTREVERTRDEFDSYNEGRKLRAGIINYRYEILNDRISRVNFEINEDKKRVSEKMVRLGFNKSYNELLDGIDDYINTDTEKFINAGMISNLRTFMADLLKDVANRIAEKENETIPAIHERGEMGNIRGYLKQKLDLSEKDDKFVTSFIDILHAEGGHAFMSDKEYFRLARNIAVEIMLFILSKYEKKYS